MTIGLDPQHCPLKSPFLSVGRVAGVEDLNEEDVTETESPAVITAITAPFGYKVRYTV